MTRSTLPIQILPPGPDADALPRLPDQSPNSCNSCLDFVSSDESLDRYSEIIRASGWKLDSYLRNPVFQNAHQTGDILHTLGRALLTEVRTREAPREPSTLTLNSPPSTFLFQRIEFAVDANPIARLAYKLYQGGFLRAVSVGFIPLRWQDPDGREYQANSSRSLSDPAAPDSPDCSRSPALPSPIEIRNPKIENPSRIYLEQELLEVSAVSIPANPNALILAYQSGAVEKSDLRDIADLCASTLSSGRAAPPHVPGHSTPATHALPPIPNYDHLAPTARLIAQLLNR